MLEPRGSRQASENQPRLQEPVLPPLNRQPALACRVHHVPHLWVRPSCLRASGLPQVAEQEVHRTKQPVSGAVGVLLRTPAHSRTPSFLGQRRRAWAEMLSCGWGPGEAEPGEGEHRQFLNV